MAQYDVYTSKAPGVFLLDVQSDLIEGLTTRVVVPLLPANAGPHKIKRLHPIIAIDGRDYLVGAHLMTSVNKSELTTPKTNLTHRHDDISKAIYMVFQGF